MSRSYIKGILKKSPALVRLELNECQSLTDKAVEELIPYLNEELLALTCCRVPLTNKALKRILSKCHMVQQLRFVGCQNLDHETIRLIGAHCSKLKNLCFIRENTKNRSGNDDVLSVLVKNCASELASISFIGFDSITDIGVNYMAECYFLSLQKVNFNMCKGLTDKGLEGLAMTCSYLKEVSLNSTSITDKGVTVLAEKCHRLQKLDLGGCAKITDQSIVCVAHKCSKLNIINLNGCSQVCDASLQALLSSCLLLQNIDVSCTGITVVPALVLSLRGLKQLEVNQCKDLVRPPQEVLERKLEGVLDFYKEYNISHRVKVHVVGDAGAGKSSLIQSLLQEKPVLVEGTTEGVVSHLWQPLKGVNNGAFLDRRVRTEEQQLLLDLWDMSGRKICRATHQVFYSQEATYVIVVNATSSSACDVIASFVSSIQSKVPGAVISIVATHADKLSNGCDYNAKSEELLFTVKQLEQRALSNIKTEINALKKLDRTLRTEQRIEELQFLLQLRPKIGDIKYVSCSNGTGLEVFKKALITSCLRYQDFPHLGYRLTPGSIQVVEKVYKMKDEGKLIMTWDEYMSMILDAEGDLVGCERTLQEETAQLNAVGAIIDFKLVDVSHTKELPLHFICTKPATLANLICHLHVDNANKSFKIEAKRFWPKSLGVKKPDPGSLVKILEDIPNKGLIRNAIFPILWQVEVLAEDQIQKLLRVLCSIGLISEHPTSSLGEDIDHLVLPNFKELSVDVAHYASLMNLLPDTWPQLNWTPQPFKGDIQLNWRYTFPNGTPSGFLERLLSVGASTKGADKPLYTYRWRCGVVHKISDAIVCIQHEGDTYVDVCCRVNADEHGREKSAVEYLWAHLAIFILAAEQFMASWSGLFDKVSLLPMGLPLFYGDVIIHERDFPLFQCLDHAQRHDDLRFIDDHKSRQLNIDLLIPYDVAQFKDVPSWIRHIHSQRDTVFSLMDEGDSDEEDFEMSPVEESSKRPSIITKTSIDRLKKDLDVRWNLPQPGEMKPAVNHPQKKPLQRRMASLDKFPTYHSIMNDQTDRKESLEEEQEEDQEPDNEINYTQNVAKVAPLSRNIPDDETDIKEDSKVSVASRSMGDVTEGTASECEEGVLKRIAARFVAAILAGAMAEHIRCFYDDSEQQNKQISLAEVRAAKLAADAAKAAQTGDMEQAARAVVLAAEGMKAEIHRMQREQYLSVKSKMCVIL